ncbi:hypothetical protein IHE44_0003112 [Lamprotornis superbus]|uniref:Uncharacterized protein n=1 Tax=Lamprotornis superbus TaxID=245042 RepID=A0A835NUM3_9PASS|nr:hypothetical protein IHE44_0003112 [Lamprotornis superbus]
MQERWKETYVLLHIPNLNQPPLPHTQLYLKSLPIQTDSFLNIALLPLDVCQIVERICMSIGQVAVGIRKVGLELNGPPVGVYGQVYQALLIVHTGKVAVHNCMIWAQTQGSQISCHSSRKKSLRILPSTAPRYRCELLGSSDCPKVHHKTEDSGMEANGFAVAVTNPLPYFSSCDFSVRSLLEEEEESPLPHKDPHPPQMVLQPNRQLRCSYTPLLSMRVGLGATAVEPRLVLISPHSSPLQRGRINADLETWCKVQVFKTLTFTCILPNTYLGFFQATQGFEQVPQVTTNTVQVLKNQNHTISFRTSDSPQTGAVVTSSWEVLDSTGLFPSVHVALFSPRDRGYKRMLQPR